MISSKCNGSMISYCICCCSRIKLLQPGGLWGMELLCSDSTHLSPSVISNYLLPSELTAALIPQLTSLGVPGEPRNWAEPSRGDGFRSLHRNASDTYAQVHHTFRFRPIQTVSDLRQAGERAGSDYPHYRLYMLLKPRFWECLQPYSF